MRHQPAAAPVSQTAAITVIEQRQRCWRRRCRRRSPVNENTAITLSATMMVVSDTPEHRRRADDDADGDERHHHDCATWARIVAGTNSSAVTLSGTAAAINTALASASYTGGLNYYGSDSLQVVTTSDAGVPAAAAPVSQSAAITVIETTTLSDMVSETVPATLTGTENTAIALSAIVVSDSPNTGDTLTTVLTVTNGTIAIATPAALLLGNERHEHGDADRDGGGDRQRGSGEREPIPAAPTITAATACRWRPAMRHQPAAAPVSQTAAITVHQQRQCA